MKTYISICSIISSIITVILIGWYLWSIPRCDCKSYVIERNTKCFEGYKKDIGTHEIIIEITGDGGGGKGGDVK